MQDQVADRIEKKLQELPWVDKIDTYSKPGFAAISFQFRDSTPPRDVPMLFLELRKKMGDLKADLPAGVDGPTINDEFGDVDSVLYTITGDGASYAQLKQVAEALRKRLQRVPDVIKVDLYGEQAERIFVESDTAKLATLGVPLQAMFDSLAKQNALTPAGEFQTEAQRVPLRVSGALQGVDAVAETPVVRQRPDVPPRRHRRGLARLRGPAVLSRARAGQAGARNRRRHAEGRQHSRARQGARHGDRRLRNRAAAGRHDRAHRRPAEGRRRRGVRIHALIPRGAGDRARRELLSASAGAPASWSRPPCRWCWRSSSSPWRILGLDLQRVTLGALIIALGLLVDDAIIAVEMIVVKLEQGWERERAASFAWTSTAFPMLTGTLVTAAGFMPIGLANSAVGEYTGGIFWVVGIALVASWFVAVLFTPFLGYKLLPARCTARHARDENAIYSTAFYRAFRRALEFCVARPLVVILRRRCAARPRPQPVQQGAAAVLPALRAAGTVLRDAARRGQRDPGDARRRRARPKACSRAMPTSHSYTTYIGKSSPRFWLWLAAGAAERIFCADRHRRQGRRSARARQGAHRGGGRRRRAERRAGARSTVSTSGRRSASPCSSASSAPNRTACARSRRGFAT